MIVATAEDIVISKLEWAKMGESDRQLRDAAGILRTRRDDLDLTYVARWVDELDLNEQWQQAASAAGYQAD